MSRLVRGVFKNNRKPRESATDTATGGGSVAAVDTLGALQATLTILRESVDGIPVPGLKTALGGLLALLTAIRVNNFPISPWCSCLPSVIRTLKATNRTLGVLSTL